VTSRYVLYTNTFMGLITNSNVLDFDLIDCVKLRKMLTSVTGHSLSTLNSKFI